MTPYPLNRTAWVPAGSQPPTKRKRMKIIKYIAVALAAIGIQTGCVVTETVAPDGTKTTTKTPAPGSIELAGQAIQVIGSRGAEKDSGK